MRLSILLGLALACASADAQAVVEESVKEVKEDIKAAVKAATKSKSEKDLGKVEPASSPTLEVNPFEPEDDEDEEDDPWAGHWPILHYYVGDYPVLYTTTSVSATIGIWLFQAMGNSMAMGGGGMAGGFGSKGKKKKKKKREEGTRGKGEGEEGQEEEKDEKGRVELDFRDLHRLCLRADHVHGVHFVADLSAMSMASVTRALVPDPVRAH